MKPKNRAWLGQISDMDLRLLRVFRTVVDCGGMAAAELELNIGTSTVSRHIKDLETRLGLTLCRRGRAGFALTPEGQQIYQQTQQLLLASEAFRNGVDEIHQRMGGQLHLAVFDKTVSNPACRISQAIALFCAQAPDVALNLHVATLNAIERGVLDGQFQIGIIPGHRNSDTLQYRMLFEESMQLYCAQGHRLYATGDAAPDPQPAEPAAPQTALCTTRPTESSTAPQASLLDWPALRNYAFAGLGYHSPNMEMSQRMRLARKATAFDQESIATLILSGQFLGFLPVHYADTFVRSGQMRALQPELFNYRCDFFSITRRSPQPSRATRAFQACLEQAHPLAKTQAELQ
jgi:DNA-binding transcriptional LysR family regulator